MVKRIEKTVLINSSLSTVWETITEPDLIKQWMAEPETEMGIHSDWKVGSPIIISGFHHAKFENNGIVLQFEPNKALVYSHLSSVSQLPDKPESYSIIGFTLTPFDNQTSLTLTINNFPTETIFKHLEFYWGSTMEMIKDFIEKTGLH